MSVNPSLEQPGGVSEDAQSVSTKPQRVLACILCRQRKKKCDRMFPCANCTRAGLQCVQANALGSRQRRRRFPEAELVNRLRYYENKLRQHNINFESLHPPIGAYGRYTPSEDGRGSPISVDDSRDFGRGKAPFNPKEPVDLWDAISRVTLESEDDDEYGDGDADGDDNDDADGSFFLDHRPVDYRNRDFRISRQATFLGKGSIQINDHLLFGPPGTNINLSTLHPDQAQIFRLWQIYLDNVNPLLRVTHTPTLQPRIIDAASNVANISPALEALIFSIYCVSIMSLGDGECRRLFRSPRKDLLAGYQFACQQASFKCGAWHSGDIDGLTATYLYLLSVRSQTDARSLSCMLAIVVRTAQRIGIHNESSYSGCGPFEAEMRRRLWWPLIIFDHRICELSNYKTTTLDPTWDCHTPVNVNDFEIRPDMKDPPASHDKPTEALFTMVRDELADFLRHSAFHLSFVNPSLTAIAQPRDAGRSSTLEGGELTALEEITENKYFAFCNADDPLHYMTIWTTRGFIARNRLLEHYSRHSTSSVKPTDSQRQAAMSYALGMLDCDTRLRASPLTQRYIWHVNSNFPMLGYVHVLTALRKRPGDELADTAWEAMSNNYATIVTPPREQGNDDQGGTYYVLALSSRAESILGAWEAREAYLRQQQLPMETTPQIVVDMRNKSTETSTFGSAELEGDLAASGIGGRNSVSGGTVIHGASTDMANDQQNGLNNFATGTQGDLFPGGITADVNMDQLLTEVDWTLMQTQGW